MLKNTFFSLLGKYNCDQTTKENAWSEILEFYQSEDRFYHTLSHLENLLEQLFPIKSNIESWETLMFSLFYHDIIYEPLKGNNEELSAELAKTRMSSFSVPQNIIDQSYQQILATKNHRISEFKDNNYFTDADLSILGQTWELYQAYYKNIRKEFIKYPDTVYNVGRIKVLQNFLKMERIFKTEHFYKLYETQARKNIEREIDLMTLESNKN